MNKTEHASTTTSRRNILMGLAAAAVVPAPALTTALGKADPILAAIDAHKAADRAFSDILTAQSELEESLPKKRRQSDWRNAVETDDPLWIANQQAVAEGNDKVWNCALALLDIRPTTVAGMVTLFRYVAEADETAFPGDVLIDDQDDSDDGVDFQTALLLTAAEWLENADSLRA